MDSKRIVFHTHDGFVKPNAAPSVLTVARCLMRETRYCGNSPTWWNVGLHSLVVCDMLPKQLKFHGLVHDEPECVTGDIPHNLKTAEQRKFEDTLLRRFYRSVGVKPPTRDEHSVVKWADRLAVNAETWAGCGTACLKTKYSDTMWRGTVEYYTSLYSYADCLDLNGAAVLEYVRRFELYKSWL